LKGEYPCPLWTYLVEVFVVRWILEKDPKLVFLCKPFMIGYKIENKYFDWIILSGRRGKILEATERESVGLSKDLVEPCQPPYSPTSILSTAPSSRTPHLVR
jgi:hypothetical protein